MAISWPLIVQTQKSFFYHNLRQKTRLIKLTTLMTHFRPRIFPHFFDFRLVPGWQRYFGPCEWQRQMSKLLLKLKSLSSASRMGLFDFDPSLEQSQCQSKPILNDFSTLKPKYLENAWAYAKTEGRF